jgi:anti-anti-sigma factor
MEITVSTEQGRVPATILHLKGDLDASSEQAVVARARELAEQGARHLVIDLTEVRYVSSAGVRALSAIYMLLRPAGEEAAVLQGLRDGTYTAHNLKLLSPNKAVHTVLTTTGLDMMLEIHPDLASAVAAF